MHRSQYFAATGRGCGHQTSHYDYDLIPSGHFQFDVQLFDGETSGHGFHLLIVK